MHYSDENLMARMQVDLPPGKLDGLAVVQFDVPDGESDQAWMENDGLRFYGAQRMPKPGRYTKLVDRSGEKPVLWMSDTTAEMRDHLPAVRRIAKTRTKRVLIHGLGLGMVLKAALSFDHVESIDVLELDPRVMDLVGPTYEKDERVVLFQGDAFTYPWPDDWSWDVIWSDIWPNIATSNLAEMEALRLRHAGRAGWHGFWARPEAVDWHHQEAGLLALCVAVNGGVVPDELAESAAEIEAAHPFAKLVYAEGV
jgi:hypothetical protein